MATSVGASAIAAVLSRVVGFARTIVLSWLISQAEFGLLGVALLIVNVLMPVCSAGLFEGVARYAPLHEASGTLRRFVGRTTVALLLLLATGSVVLWVGAGVFSEPLLATAREVSVANAGSGAVDESQRLMQAVIVCVVSLAVLQTLIGLLKGLRMFRAVGAAEVIAAASFTILAIGAALAGWTTARTMVLAYAAGCSISVLLMVPGVVRQLGRLSMVHVTASSAPRRPKSGLLTYSVWAAGTAVLWHALILYPMWYLLKVTDPSTAGLFHAARTITQLAHLSAVLMIGIVSANLTHQWEANGRDATRPQLLQLTRMTTVALFVIGAALAAGRPLLMGLFPGSFQTASVAYDPLLLLFVLVGFVGLIAVRMNLAERPGLVFLAWLLGASVNVVVAYFLLNDIGWSAGDDPTEVLRAAAWAGVAGVSVALVSCVAAARRVGLAVDRVTLAMLACACVFGFGWRFVLPATAIILAVYVARGGLVRRA